MSQLLGLSSCPTDRCDLCLGTEEIWLSPTGETLCHECAIYRLVKPRLPQPTPMGLQIDAKPVVDFYRMRQLVHNAGSGE